MLTAILTSSKVKKIIPVIGLIILVGGLGLFTFLSYYNRYWADDWCYNADLRNKGFMETLRGYFYDTTYTPSRYSVTIFAGLLQAFEVLGVQWMTPLTILFWVVGLFFIFRNIARLAGLQPFDQTQGKPAPLSISICHADVLSFTASGQPLYYDQNHRRWCIARGVRSRREHRLSGISNAWSYRWELGSRRTSALHCIE